MEMTFRTWNVRTLYKPRDAQYTRSEVDIYRLKVVAIQVIKLKETGNVGINNMTFFFCRCN